MIGTKLLHYEIVEKIGEGGMGEVYRATDTRLGREVAIKVLPPAFVEDEERLARFEREAQVLASLNHQRIASIYGLEHAENQRFLVLELVEGPTLAERIAAGALSVEQSIEIALQLAEGLEVAHEAGIVHRDLKPANVKVSNSGAIKILDFGLAKAWESPVGDSNLSQSPTITAQMTQAGVILGTAAYMSPEQARGQEADKRSDIWAFGVILWEMVTGRRLFEGETVTDVLASVLKERADLQALPRETPGRLRTLLGRCLERDPSQRLRDIGEARIVLSQPMGARPEESLEQPESKRRHSLLWALGGVAVGVAATLVALLTTGERSEVPTVRASIPLTPAARLDLGSVFSRETIAISPDGREIAFAALDREGSDGARSLWIRNLADSDARPVVNSEGGHSPFYSPDGQSLGFLKDGEIVLAGAGGGAAQPIPTPSATFFSSAAFDSRGLITALVWVRGEDGGSSALWSIDPVTGTVAERHRFEQDPGSDIFRTWVQPLPGDRGVLYSAVDTDAPGESGVMVLDLRNGEETLLVSGGLRPRLSPEGNVFYCRGGRLLLAPFDLDRLEVTGPPRVVLEDLAVSLLYGQSWYEISTSGTLISVAAREIEGGMSSMLRVDQDGSSRVIEGRARYFVDPRVSPDGRHLAFSAPTAGNDVWVHNFERNTQTRLSFDSGEDETPIWSPSGEWVAWVAERDNRERALVRRRADGSGTTEHLWGSEKHFHASDWSSDGGFVLVDLRDRDSGFDIWKVPLEDSTEAGPVLSESHHELHARLSPDGRWLSYTSNETGTDEVYLQSFPELDRKVQVSAEGGYQPLWSSSGDRLFFRSEQGMWAVTVEEKASLQLSTPELLFARKYAYGKGYGHFGYDAAPDGTFIMSGSDTAFLPQRLDLLIGWSETVDLPD